MSKNKIKLTVLIPIDRLMSVLESANVLKQLSDEYELTILAPCSAITPKGYQIIFFKESKIGAFYRELLLNANTIRLYSLVKSFETRVKVTLGLHKSQLEKFNKRKIYIFSQMFKPRTFLSLFISTLTPKFEEKLRSLANYWPSLRKNIVKAEPQLILIFTGGAFTGVENVALSHAAKLGLKSILVVDNWDNLSSKSIFWSSPTAIGVWGENMLANAREIHNMNSTIVRFVGSARFRPNERPLSSFNYDFVLFAGSGKPLINEPKAVFDVRRILDTMNFEDVKLIYRPHPMSNIDIARIKDLFSQFRNIEFDNSFGDNLKDNFYRKKPLEHLEELCSAAKFVIAPLSSIIVESLSMGTPVISFNWSDQEGNERPLSEYTHFHELNGVKGFFPIDSIDAFASTVLRIQEIERGYNFVPRILPTFENTYVERINSLIEDTLSGELT